VKAFAANPSLRKFIQGRYEQRDEEGTPLAELAFEGMWWAVRNLARRQAASPAEYEEVFHGKTAAQWARYYGLSSLSKELEYYVSARHIRPTDLRPLAA
jgi:hypothetical protein